MKKKSVIFFFVSEKEFIDGSKSMAYSQPLCHTSHPEIKKGMVFSSSKPTNLIYKMVGNAKECSNYRTIALISHASKVMLQNSPRQASALHEPRTSRCSSWF